MLYSLSLFFFTHTSTTEIYTLSLHDALPISERGLRAVVLDPDVLDQPGVRTAGAHAVELVPEHLERLLHALLRLEEQFHGDRKSTRLNSSHMSISYAVFCLKKKKTYILTVHI